MSSERYWRGGGGGVGGGGGALGGGGVEIPRSQHVRDGEVERGWSLGLGWGVVVVAVGRWEVDGLTRHSAADCLHERRAAMYVSAGPVPHAKKHNPTQ